MIQLDVYLYVHVSGQGHTGLKTKTSSTSPGIMVHVLFVFFAIFENLKVS